MNTKHKYERSPIGWRPYSIWRGMKQRCSNKNAPNYSLYGGRGITFCSKWNTFAGFWEDMKDDYKDNLTLDRKDNNANYDKKNCRWADNETQQNNKRTSSFLTYKGKTMSVAMWGRELKMPRHVLYARLKRGCNIKRIFTQHNLENPITRYIDYNGKKLTYTQLSELSGISRKNITSRLLRGWTVERTLSTPVQIYFYKNKK